MCFSFFYTEKTVSVVKEHDEIMIELREKLDRYQTPSVDAKVEKNTIIPGIAGTSVDVNKSYNKMKRYGKYNETLIVYKETYPTISIKNNYDKFVISGNPASKSVSLIFKVRGNNDIKSILKILNEKEIKANFFVDDKYLDYNDLSLISKYNHNIGNLINDYSESSFSWLNNRIKKVTKNTYCYDEKNNLENLNICSINKIYTIKPSIIVETNPTITIKDNLKNGSIISFNINTDVINELSVIINYIRSKDIKIILLDELLDETYNK